MRIEKILLNLTQCKFSLSIKCYRFLNALLTHSPNWNEKIRFWAIANFSQFKVFDVVCNRMLNRQFTIFNKYYIEHRENDKATKKTLSQISEISANFVRKMQNDTTKEMHPACLTLPHYKWNILSDYSFYWNKLTEI